MFPERGGSWLWTLSLKAAIYSLNVLKHKRDLMNLNSTTEFNIWRKTPDMPKLLTKQ